MRTFRIEEWPHMETVLAVPDALGEAFARQAHGCVPLADLALSSDSDVGLEVTPLTGADEAAAPDLVVELDDGDPATDEIITARVVTADTQRTIARFRYHVSSGGSALIEEVGQGKRSAEQQQAALQVLAAAWAQQASYLTREGPDISGADFIGVAIQQITALHQLYPDLVPAIEEI